MVDTRFSVSIQIMMSLAYYGEDELSSSESLARSLKTNPTFIRKLVSSLVEHELIESFRGKGGGIKLAKSPDKISLNDIYIASTGEKRLISVHQKPVVKSCAVSNCIDGVLDDIVCGLEKTTQAYLAKKYLSDLMKKVK